MTTTSPSCPTCGSTNMERVETTTIENELLECQSCLRAYEVTQAQDGSDKLVAV